MQGAPVVNALAAVRGSEATLGRTNQFPPAKKIDG